MMDNLLKMEVEMIRPLKPAKQLEMQLEKHRHKSIRDLGRALVKMGVFFFITFSAGSNGFSSEKGSKITSSSQSEKSAPEQHWANHHSDHKVASAQSVDLPKQQTFSGRGFSVRVVFNKNPSTSADILWETDSDDLKGKTLYFDTVDRGLSLSKYRNSVSPTKITKYGFVRDIYSAVVELKNLTPSTEYFFVIYDSEVGAVSKRYSFYTTAATSDTPLYIVAGGDSRNNREVRRRSNLLVKKLAPDVVFFGGDFTNLGQIPQWRGWFEDWEVSFSAEGRITPIVVARGNHEYSNATLESLFNTREDVYYHITFHDDLLSLLVLNSEISVAGDQLEWLKKVIPTTTDYRWSMAMYHKPMRPHARNKSEAWHLSRYWAPLFHAHLLDLAVESDTHLMKVTWPIRPSKDGDQGFVRDDKEGTVFVGEGSWGAPLRRANNIKDWTRAAASINQFKWMKVTSKTMTVRTVETDNAAVVGRVSRHAFDRFEKPRGLRVYSGDGGEVRLSVRKKLSLDSR